jgi:plasmid stability protein
VDEGVKTMATVRISESLFKRLQDRAERENRSVDDIAEAILEQQVAYEYRPERDPLLLIAAAAEEAGIHSEKGDIAERSRELLTGEIPDYLRKRLNGQENDGE